jgi:conjugative relaxase-like TrwC/TraI family protein
VLTVAKIAGSGAAAYGEYLEGRTVAVEAGDYYLAADGERVEAPGRWLLGEQGAATLGVDAGRSVAAEQFQMLMAVQNPATGGRLRAGGAGGSSVAAIDATFSAPKSVSAVWALASPELRAEIELAQERAVDSALAHAVEYVPMVRRRVDRETVLRETPGELVATSWRHTTARAVAGRAPDPQLHSHVVLHGAVRQGDGKVVAIESRAWLVHQREVGAAYRTQLASELGELGFNVEAGTGRGGRYFELTGVPQGLIEAWSGRHRQVQQQIQRRLSERLAGLQAQVDAGGPDADGAQARLVALERSGQLMPAEQRAVAMRTRAAKGKGGLETAGDLDRAWYDAAQEHDFDARSVQALRDPARAVDVAEPASAREHQLEQRILERLTEFDATFAPREARAVALEVSAGEDPVAGLVVLERLRDRREILELADGRETTRSHRGTERAAVAAVHGLADATAEPIAVELVDDELSELRSELALGGDRLAIEQEQAIRVACSDQQLVVIVGQAGTGKSTALTAVARAHQEAGQKIVVTSTGAQAAERLAAEFSAEGVSAVAGCSTRALQAAFRRGTVTLSPGVTVIHDEAALASTREQSWLLEAVAETGARLIEVGDPRQSQAVGAGGLWPHIEAAAGEQGGLVELSRIVRAKDAADRRDQARWRAGMHDQALAGYATRGRLLLADTQRQAEDHALEAAHEDRRAGKTALVVVQTSNDALDGLNARAQALRIQDGFLVGDREIALAGRPYGLRAGDEIVLRAASVHPELGAVANGTRGTVLDAADDEHATLRLADGREAVWERGQLDAASARLAYVSHTFPAQGQTVDRAHVIAGEHADANGTYVALTRAREQTHLYASVERLSPGDEPADGVLSDRQALLEALAGQLGREEVELPSIAVALAHERHVEAELDRESEPDVKVAEPPRRAERDELDERRQERDRLRAVVDSYPAEAAREIDRLWQAGMQEREAADSDTERAAHWQGQYDDLGVLRRRGTEGREIHDRAEQFTARAEQQQQHADQLAAQARVLADGPDGPAAWEHAHPAVREQLLEAETALAAAVDQRVVWERSGSAAGGSESFDPGTAHQQLAWLSAERDRLKAELRGYPRQHARDAEHADQQAALADRSAQAARERAQQVEREREELGRLARRGRRGSDAEERQHRFQEQAEHHDQRADTERQTARLARERPGGPVEWERSHPGVRDRLSIYEHAHQVAAEQQARRLLASDPTIAVRVLGPRPRSPEQRTVWDRGAEAISSYRAAHEITDQDTVLGAEPDSGAPGGFQRHADWKHAAELALQARRELGVDPGRGRGPITEQARQVPELTPPPPEIDRGHDRGLGFEM